MAIPQWSWHDARQDYFSQIVYLFSKRTLKKKLCGVFVSITGYNKNKVLSMKNSNAQEKWMKTVTALWPVAKGSLREVKKTCSQVGCKACLAGERHAAWLFTYYLDGKQRSKHVPKSEVENLKKALANGRELERMILDSGLHLLRESKKK